MSAVATGLVENVYPGQDGVAVTTPLAGWVVFDDANANGVRDRPETAAVTELDGSYALTLASGSHTLRLAQKAGWSTPAGYAGSATMTVGAGTDAVHVETLSTTMASPVVIDVAAVTADSSLDWASLIPGYIRQANQVFANSDTNVRINLVGIRPANYAASGNLSLDLARLAATGDGYMDEVPALRDQLGADLVILFDPMYTAVAAGLAYIPNTASPNAALGYAVCCYSGNTTFDGYTVAHELGHTLGADHDADHGPGGTPAYARGYRFTGADGVLYHDVMAYPPGTTLPFFSSPVLSYAGHALGVAKTADNVRAIRETAAEVAAYRHSRASAAVATQPTTPAVVTVSAKTGKARVLAGKRVATTAVVRNTSGKKFSGKIFIAFYLSTDRNLDADDTLLGRKSVRVRGIKPHGTVRAKLGIRMARETKSGKYYVLAVATTTGKAVDELPAQTSAAPLRVATVGTSRKALVEDIASM